IVPSLSTQVWLAPMNSSRPSSARCTIVPPVVRCSTLPLPGTCRSLSRQVPTVAAPTRSRNVAKVGVISHAPVLPVREEEGAVAVDVIGGDEPSIIGGTVAVGAGATAAAGDVAAGVTAAPGDGRA